MAKYLIDFYWSGPSRISTSGTNTITTDLNPESQEFSQLVSQNCNFDWEIFDGDEVDFDEYPPTIQVYKINEPFTPKDVVKYWIEG